MMSSKGGSLVYLVTCSELGVAVCTTVGITSEEDASESFSGIGIPKNGSLFMLLDDGASCYQLFEASNQFDAAGSGATTSGIRAMTSGVGDQHL
ncbi:hypothetical protein Tco_0311692 [Tanacetum coccineum]